MHGTAGAATSACGSVARVATIHVQDPQHFGVLGEVSGRVVIVVISV